jgi:hypothetical protein
MAREKDPDTEGLAHLLTWVQDGVSRRQLRGLHFTHGDLERMLRRKELARVVTGVFVNHTGELTRQQREWVAVHAHWPAALAGLSALPSPPPRAVIDVAIAQHRTVKPVQRVRAHRTSDLDTRVDWTCAPPRMKLEHALIDAVTDQRTDVLAMFRLLADVVQTKRTSAAAVAKALKTRRVPGKAVLLEMLDDLATGACSVLEREYLVRVERAHGLPEGRRQAPGTAAGRRTERDVHYVRHGLLVELDGRAFHDNARARDDDARRDLDARVGEELVTVRLTYGLVLGTPCWTATRVAHLLRRGGWSGTFLRCPSCPDHLDV